MLDREVGAHDAAGGGADADVVLDIQPNKPGAADAAALVVVLEGAGAGAAAVSLVGTATGVNRAWRPYG